MRRLIRVLITIAVFVGIALFPVARTAASDVIRIGVLMNLTGPWASIEGPAWNSVQLAVNNINEAGGLLGKTVEAIAIDTKTDETTAVNAVVRLIEEEKVNAIIGYCNTNWALITAPIAREYRMPFVTAGATHPRIPERSGAWLACFGDNAQASVLAEYAIKNGLKRVAVWVDRSVDVVWPAARTLRPPSRNWVAGSYMGIIAKPTGQIFPLWWTD